MTEAEEAASFLRSVGEFCICRQVSNSDMDGEGLQMCSLEWQEQEQVELGTWAWEEIRDGDRGWNMSREVYTVPWGVGVSLCDGVADSRSGLR